MNWPLVIAESSDCFSASTAASRLMGRDSSALAARERAPWPSRSKLTLLVAWFISALLLKDRSAPLLS